MEEPKQQPDKMKIVGLNVGIFALYTLICALTPASIFGAIVPLGIHLLICFILAIVYKSWAWALSILVLILIGFSTCVVTLASS